MSDLVPIVSRPAPTVRKAARPPAAAQAPETSPPERTYRYFPYILQRFLLDAASAYRADAGTGVPHRLGVIIDKSI